VSKIIKLISLSVVVVLFSSCSSIIVELNKAMDQLPKGTDVHKELYSGDIVGNVYELRLNAFLKQFPNAEELYLNRIDDQRPIKNPVDGTIELGIGRSETSIIEDANKIYSHIEIVPKSSRFIVVEVKNGLYGKKIVLVNLIDNQGNCIPKRNTAENVVPLNATLLFTSDDGWYHFGKSRVIKKVEMDCEG
jgi:hypothetical protein